MHLLLLLGSVCVSAQELWGPATVGSGGTLLQAHIIFRHGHRVPKKGFPLDPNYNAPLWKDGFIELTNMGRRQAFQLGRNLRARYKTLLPDERAWKSVKTLSSDVSRTLMTAQVVLAGLLPPEGSDRWSDLDWQPAPVHTKPTSDDHILVSSLPCPRLKTLQNKLPQDVSEETREMYEYVERHSGKITRTAVALSNLYSCLVIEEQAGLTLPEWTRRVFPEPMRSEAAKSLLRSTATLQMARLRAGPLLKELTHFNAKIIGEPLRLYSTHDTVISGLLGALSQRISRPPNFMSVVAFEYWNMSDGDIQVQLWWREGPYDELIQLDFPKCGRNCSLETLKNILELSIPDDWVEECDDPAHVDHVLNKTENHDRVAEITWTVWRMLLFVMLSISVLFLLLFRHRLYHYELL